jgi:predicted ATP-grasp superfamily ATP-dependent carboligase
MRTCLILDAEMQCALPVIESLHKQGFQVTAGSHKRINMGFFSRYTSERIIYPHPEKCPAAFLERISKLVKDQRYDFILPTDDISGELLTAHKTELENYTHFPVVPHEIFMKARDKSQTLKIALQRKVPCPSTFFPDEQNIEEIADNLSYPALVKPNRSSGARGISLVASKADLATTYKAVKASFGECHIQEYVPKGGLQYKADLFLDRNQNLKAGIVYSKLRYFPINGGSSIVNRTVLFPQILENAHKILQAMEWYGFADFDFITDPRDGVPKIVEINPRVPACFRITLGAGIDFSYLIARLAMGEEIPQIDGYKLDVYLRYLPLDILWFFKSPDRFRAKPNFFKFFGRNLHDQIISLRDPGPIFGFCLENFLSLFDWEARKTRYSRGW